MEILVTCFVSFFWKQGPISMHFLNVLHCADVQGVSAAGLQRGMSDCRSSLVKHPFRIFDCLPNACRAQQRHQDPSNLFDSECYELVFHFSLNLIFMWG